ncbi:hypothetical protein Tco_0025040 [Tanacetum coccineum]
MANENVPAHAPIRSDDQILPFSAWVPIRKSNFILDLQKKQMNPIFQIFMDILQNTNFFRAFTTLAYLDENQFILDANLLRESLEITPIDQAHQFVSPSSGDAIMDFANELRYTEELHFTSRMTVNNLTNVDYAEFMWEEFVQAIQTFLADKANLGIATQKGKKTKPHVIPYCRFTKLIICYLGRTRNIHQRSTSLFHLVEEDHRLGNLKFVPKGEEDEVFGMQIPKELITDNIRNTSYYNAYLEMVVKHDHKIAAAEGGKKKSASEADQSKKPTTAKQSKPMSLESFQAHGQAVVGDVAFCKHTALGITQNLPVVEGKGKAKQDVTTRPSTQPKDDTSINMVHESPSPVDAKTDASVELSVSEADTEILSVGEELPQGKEVLKTVTLEERTVDVDEGQAGSDPGKSAESQPPPEHEVMKEDQAKSNPGLSHVALAGPDPKPM